MSKRSAVDAPVRVASVPGLGPAVDEVVGQAGCQGAAAGCVQMRSGARPGGQVQIGEPETTRSVIERGRCQAYRGSCGDRGPSRQSACHTSSIFRRDIPFGFQPKSNDVLGALGGLDAVAGGPADRTASSDTAPSRRQSPRRVLSADRSTRRSCYSVRGGARETRRHKARRGMRSQGPALMLECYRLALGHTGCGAEPIGEGTVR